MATAVLQFLILALVILIAGSRLSFYGDVIADRSGFGRTWVGVILMASVTSVPELATGISSVTVVGSPDIALGDVLGSCMFNLVILALVDVARRGPPLATRVHHGHIIAAAFGVFMLAIVGAGQWSLDHALEMAKMCPAPFGGVVALAEQDGHELRAGVEVDAGLADGLEGAVEFGWAGAVAVAE